MHCPTPKGFVEGHYFADICENEFPGLINRGWSPLGDSKLNPVYRLHLKSLTNSQISSMLNFWIHQLTLAD